LTALSLHCAPDRGDVVWLSFDPQAGHEQAGHRLALTVSPRSCNAKIGLALFCPITSQTKGYPSRSPFRRAARRPVSSWPIRWRASTGGLDKPSLSPGFHQPRWAKSWRSLAPCSARPPH